MKRMVLAVALVAMSVVALADIPSPGRRGGGGPPRPYIRPPVEKKKAEKKPAVQTSTTATTDTTSSVATTTTATATTATTTTATNTVEPQKPVEAAVATKPDSNTWPLVSVSVLGLVAVVLLFFRRRRVQ